jgi:hypothetical protein
LSRIEIFCCFFFFFVIEYYRCSVAVLIGFPRCTRLNMIACCFLIFPVFICPVFLFHGSECSSFSDVHRVYRFDLRFYMLRVYISYLRSACVVLVYFIVFGVSFFYLLIVWLCCAFYCFCFNLFFVCGSMWFDMASQASTTGNKCVNVVAHCERVYRWLRSH